MKNLIRFEDLPNELLINIFQYIDARRLYHGFYNLNYRFNILLNSLTQLCLVLYTSKDDDYYDNLFLSRVSTLVVYHDIIFTLSRYINVRHIILFNSKRDQMSEIMIDGTNLESISLVSPRCFYTTFYFHEMIFSNKFPHLKSCYLTTVYLPSIQVRQLSWSQSPSINSLRISSHDPLIHMAILNTCPNLNFLHLSLFQLDYTPLDIKPHRNLKKMKLILDNLLWPLDEMIFETFFLPIPCLERLNVQRSAALPETFNDLLQYDWLARIITKQLVFLKQFIFRLHLLNSQKIDQCELDKNIYRIQKNFVNIFQNCKNYHLYISKM